jgi:transposase
LGPYVETIKEMLAENETLPRKQRYTARKMFVLIQKDGYSGSEGSVRRLVRQMREENRQTQAFLPLEFDPGQDGQVDWGEAVVILAGVRVKVHLFVMRLNYSRARFAMAFPFQKQEAFFEGHVEAFAFFGGVVRRLSYDNLKAAVYRILEGRQREEQAAFIALRSHYLFEAHYCTPGQGHEKGGVENDVGYIRRNALVPLPEVASFEELNALLRRSCLEMTHHQQRGQTAPIAQLWEQEKPLLFPLPKTPYRACRTKMVKVNPYAQIVFETNRYSVPAEYVKQTLTLRAYPFRVELLCKEKVVATHRRCFQREQDLLDPLHYLALLVQRPGAFEHALPMRRWRKTWPAVYDAFLAELRQRWPDGRGVREFLAILKLHQTYPAARLQKAMQAALTLGAVHLDGVQLYLRQEETPASLPAPLDLSAYSHLETLGTQSLPLAQYDQLLGA